MFNSLQKTEVTNFVLLHFRGIYSIIVMHDAGWFMPCFSGRTWEEQLFFHSFVSFSTNVAGLPQKVLLIYVFRSYGFWAFRVFPLSCIAKITSFDDFFFVSFFSAETPKTGPAEFLDTISFLLQFSLNYAWKMELASVSRGSAKWMEWSGVRGCMYAFYGFGTNWTVSWIVV